LELAHQINDVDDPSDLDTLHQFQQVFKPDGIGAEMIMLRTPNKPLTKNNRIVIVYLFLFIATLSMNVVLALAEQRFVTPIVVAAFWVIDIAVFFSIWRSSSSYIERDPEVPFV